jgi:mRNA-degrading endonuclease toxin of MazEF toxin-antitoxin module
MNIYLKTLIIAPLVENATGYPTRPKIKQSNQTKRVVLDQLTAIDKKQAVKILGDLQGSEIKKIKAVLKETYID